ncbi:MAG: macro domain-containing protein [Clostridia bacterium]|nr:macro domain-containing protein [Clostridia bacterium]
MPFQIIQNDIAKVTADVIVNSANPAPRIGGGTDRAIYDAAGAEALLAERKKIGVIKTGEAAATPAFGLSAEYIIHTVGPVWNGGSCGEAQALNSCYVNSLSLAVKLSAQSIAFPLISTGIFGYPKEEALSIALNAVSTFLQSHDINVILVVYDRKDFELSSRLAADIDKYIEVNLHPPLCSFKPVERAAGGFQRRAEQQLQMQTLDVAEASELSSAYTPAPESKSLDQILNDAGESFQQRLFELIDESGMDDVTVYKKANIDRKLFSRIRCKADYKPKKRTAVAFAIALRLDMPTMLDLLSRAEIAFSPSSKFDLIITYCVNHGIYDIFEINSILFKYGEPVLGE